MLLHCNWRISCSCRNRLLWNRYPKYSNFHIFYPLQYADFRNLFPIAQHSFLEIMKGMKGNMFSFFGFEMLLLYYPFIRKAKTSQKYAHYANLVTTIVYTYLMILTLAFLVKNNSRARYGHI